MVKERIRVVQERIGVVQEKISRPVERLRGKERDGVVQERSCDQDKERDENKLMMRGRELTV